ncbi:MAG: hypothetical protein ACYC06_11710 [Ilumatobacteraceae bacterium]
MTNKIETPLTKFANVMQFNSSIQFRGLRAEDLPEPDYRSTYALELAFLFGFYTHFDLFKIKGGSRFRKNAVWESLMHPLGLAVGIGFATLAAKQKSIFTQRNAEYLRNELNCKQAVLGSLVVLPDDSEHGVQIEPSWVFARSVRMIDAAVKSANLTYASGNEMFRIRMMIPIEIGALTAVRGLLSSVGVGNDVFEPLRATPDASKFRIPSGKHPHPTTNEAPEPRSHPVEGLSNAGSAEPQYEEWIRYCKDAAQLQRLPERLIVDLIPPREVANHSLKDLTAWEDALEETFPGRRQWLLNEGVTRKDFDTFWGFPSWVQNFIEALMERNIKLEFQGHLKTGLTKDLAIITAAMFIPTYEVSPGESSARSAPLPIELFERVRRHMSSLTDERYQSDFIANKCEVANQYIRMKIKNGEI